MPVSIMSAPSQSQSNDSLGWQNVFAKREKQERISWGVFIHNNSTSDVGGNRYRRDYP